MLSLACIPFENKEQQSADKHIAADASAWLPSLLLLLLLLVPLLLLLLLLPLLQVVFVLCVVLLEQVLAHSCSTTKGSSCM